MWLFYGAMACFGLVFGSFGNVVIWRLPRGESLSVPPSHCPVCETGIAWYDNIPVLSWLLLRARCRSCGVPISARYPAVELLSGMLWLLAAVKFGMTWSCAAAVVLYYILLLLSFIDIDTMRLPNSLVGVLALLGLVGVAASVVWPLAILPLTSSGGIFGSPLIAASSGVILGGGLSLAIAAAYKAIRSAEGFGMGDVKLLAVLGLYCGPYVLLVLFFGSVLGAIYGLAVARLASADMRTHFPFGPFLAAAAVAVTVAGPGIWAWYVRVLGG